MNLRLIEKRFQNLEIQANYLNYKYNPNSQKIKGLTQHAYLDELKTDHESDLKVFGQDPFHTKPVDKLAIENSKKALGLRDSAFSNQSSMYEDYDQRLDNYGQAAQRQGRGFRPLTSQPPQHLGAGGTASAARFGNAANLRAISSQQQILKKKMRYYQNSSHYDWKTNDQMHDWKRVPSAGHILDQAGQKEIIIKQQMHKKRMQQQLNQNSQKQLFQDQKHFLQAAAAAQNAYGFQPAPVSQKPKGVPQSYNQNIRQIMEALNKIKIPDHIFKVLSENRELIEQHFQVNERLLDEHERVVPSPFGIGKKSRQHRSKKDQSTLEKDAGSGGHPSNRVPHPYEPTMQMSNGVPNAYSLSPHRQRSQKSQNPKVQSTIGSNYDMLSSSRQQAHMNKEGPSLNQQQAQAVARRTQQKNYFGNQPSMSPNQGGKGPALQQNHNMITPKKMSPRFINNPNMQTQQYMQPQQIGKIPIVQGQALNSSMGQSNQVKKLQNLTTDSMTDDAGVHTKVMSSRQENIFHQDQSRTNPNSATNLQKLKQKSDSFAIDAKQNQSLAHQLRASQNQLFNEELQISNTDSMNHLNLGVNGSSQNIKDVIQKDLAESPMNPQRMKFEDKEQTIYKQANTVYNASSQKSPELKGQNSSSRQGADGLKNLQEDEAAGLTKEAAILQTEDDEPNDEQIKLRSRKITDVQKAEALNEDISTNDIYLDPRSLEKEDQRGHAEGSELHLANAINSQNSIQIKNSRISVTAGSKLSNISAYKRGGTAMRETGVSIASTSHQVQDTPLPAMQPRHDLYKITKEKINFNLKITDLSELTNPFVYFQNVNVTRDGFLILSDDLGSPTPINDPCQLFPWLKKPEDLERRTLKIEILYKNGIIMCRYLHLSKLYPIEYPKIALQISTNIYQNQYLFYKEKKLQKIYKEQYGSKGEMKEGKHTLNPLPEDPIVAAAGPSSPENAEGTTIEQQKAQNYEDSQDLMENKNDDLKVNGEDVQRQLDMQTLRDLTKVLVFDGAKNVEIDPDQCILLMKNFAHDKLLKNFGIVNDESIYQSPHGELQQNPQLQLHYYFMQPAEDRNYKLLKDLIYHKFHLKELPERIRNQDIISSSKVKPDDLVQFPKFSNHNKKIMIEFQDCIIQGVDLVDFQILIDDDAKRTQALVDFEEKQKITIEMIKGRKVNQDVSHMKTYNNLFGPPKIEDVYADQAKQVVQPDPEAMQKQISQAQQQRGMSLLIRKYHHSKATENRKKSQRRPLEPNRKLVKKGPDNEASLNSTGPICAAEMTNKRDIFNHLVGTSLLTAPLFSNTQIVRSQQNHVPDSYRPILSQNMYTQNSTQDQQSYTYQEQNATGLDSQRAGKDQSANPNPSQFQLQLLEQRISENTRANELLKNANAGKDGHTQFIQIVESGQEKNGAVQTLTGKQNEVVVDAQGIPLYPQFKTQEGSAPGLTSGATRYKESNSLKQNPAAAFGKIKVHRTVYNQDGVTLAKQESIKMSNTQDAKREEQQSVFSLNASFNMKSAELNSTKKLNRVGTHLQDGSNATANPDQTANNASGVSSGKNDTVGQKAGGAGGNHGRGQVPDHDGSFQPSTSIKVQKINAQGNGNGPGNVAPLDTQAQIGGHHIGNTPLAVIDTADDLEGLDERGLDQPHTAQLKTLQALNIRESSDQKSTLYKGSPDKLDRPEQD